MNHPRPRMVYLTVEYRWGAKIADILHSLLSLPGVSSVYPGCMRCEDELEPKIHDLTKILRQTYRAAGNLALHSAAFRKGDETEDVLIEYERIAHECADKARELLGEV